jgi:hypothetical protein
LLSLASCALLLNAFGGARGERVVLLPQLHNGETLLYESRARIDRHVATTSNVATMLHPGQTRQELATLVRLSVQEARLVDNKLLMSGAAELQAPPSKDSDALQPAPKGRKITFTIGGDGGLTGADGLDDLAEEQLLTWQFWLAQFAFGWTLPAAGVKPGEKWKSEEVEKTPTPIANLVWERENTYVENDKCPIVADQQCAVFLISSRLKQKSNPSNTTPDDYQVRQLKTSGTATGSNETVAYISLKTRLLVRATEDLQQFMVVTIAKTDDSNRVHYDMKVISHFETAFVPKS